MITTKVEGTTPSFDAYYDKKPYVTNGKIVFQRGSFYPIVLTQIYIMNYDGSGLAQLTYKGYNEFPRWSRDGKKIIFDSDRTGNFQIYVMNPDGSHQNRITHDRNDYWEPCWSPDGMKIVCTGAGIGGRSFSSPNHYKNAIFIMNADGSNVRQLTPYDGYGSPCYSPDGTKIACQHCYSEMSSGFMDICVIDIDTGAITPLFTNVLGCNARPYWSPDGKRIVFHSNRQLDGTLNIYVMNAHGSNHATRLTNYWIDETPCWSPDGEKIVFSRGNMDWSNFNIYTMNIHGTDITQLTSGGSDICPDWQPV